MTIAWDLLVTIIIATAEVGLIIYQSVKRSAEKTALRTYMQAEYNHHYEIGRLLGIYERVRDKKKVTNERKIEEANRCIEAIRGTADAARHEIIAYSREHLKFTPKYEHPATPIPVKTRFSRRKLMQLHQLYESGVIDNDEFKLKKRQVLGI